MTDSAPGFRFSITDLCLVGVVLAAALVVRLPSLQLIPVVTDESFEVLSALSVSRGDFILFGPVDPTTGPLVTYLLALCFWILGSGSYLPRIAIMVVGVLTVGLTYVLGHLMGGRKAGLVAATLLAFSPVHILVNSHIAWSNSATPLFTTLASVVLYVAVRRRAGWLLVLGGFLSGLALQTHVSVVVVLVGLLLWFLVRRDLGSWLRRPWPYLAGAAALLGYGNMIVFNLTSASGSLADFQQHTYAWVTEPSWASYGANLKAMVEAVALTLGGQVPRIQVFAGDGVTALLLLWLAASLAYAVRRREWMPVWVLLVALLLMPYFNKRYEGLLSQRYTAFLLPLCFATMGMAAAALFEGWQKRRSRPARAALAAGALLALVLAVFPVRATWMHYATESRAGRDNTLSLEMSGYLRDTLPEGALLYLSSNLQGARADGGFRYLRAVYYYLTLEGVEHWVLELPDLVARLEDDPAQEAWLLLPSEDYEVLVQQLGLEPVAGAPPVYNEGVLARYAPRAGQP